MEISKRVQRVQPSGIRRFFDLVLGMKEVISLGVGEPDFITPWQIREAGIYSLEQGFTSYTSNKGLFKLRMGISRYLKSRYGLEYSPEDEILVTVGVSEGLDLVLRAIINPQDRILIPSPRYVSYGPLTELSGGIPVYLNTERQRFKLTPDIIERHVNSKAKAIILNYPANPTGISYTKKELERIKRAILKYNLICISDEIYGDLTYDFLHVPFATLAGAKNSTVYLSGFSKSYAMTGWRVGFACGPKRIIDAMTKIHQYTTMCVSITSQMAAYEALQTARSAVDEMRREYRRRREYVVDRLKELGIECVRPDGAFYVFASIKDTAFTSVDFAQRLLREQRVAVVPGTAFGEEFDGYIRISYASSFENLKEALIRIERFLKKNQRQ